MRGKYSGALEHCIYSGFRVDGTTTIGDCAIYRQSIQIAPNSLTEPPVGQSLIGGLAHWGHAGHVVTLAKLSLAVLAVPGEC